MFPRRRLAAALVLAAALAVAAFGAGFLVGDADDRETAVVFDTTRVVRLDSGPASGTVSAVVRVGRRDPQGNLLMVLAVSGLEQLPLGDYYALSMTEDGEPEVDCGTFNVRGGKRVFVRFSVGYGLEEFDGFALTRYTSEGHETTTLLTGRLA